MKKTQINLAKVAARIFQFSFQTFLFWMFVCCLFSLEIHAQNASDEDDFIHPTRPGVTTPAEIQKPGVLQVEYGYDANFRSKEFETQQLAPLSLRFAATSRLLLEFDLDTVESIKPKETALQQTETGVGDARIGFQTLILKDTERHPALAFAYILKIPAASDEKKLGSGRTDHRIVALLDKKFGKTELEINAAYLNVGREDSSRRADGGQLAIALFKEFKNNFGLDFELSGQSVDDVLPRGTYALGALTYKFNKRLRVDTGMRFGLDREAPRFGIFAGFTLGATNPFEQ